jgi:hypothetical protein
MNEFEVEASEEAEHQLARIWISAGADRSAVVAAQHDAERKLAANPTKAGRHVAEGLSTRRPAACGLLHDPDG